MHVLHGTVTNVAVNASRNVNAVIEVHKVGQFVDLVPLKRLARFIALA
jgi:hypothetical protein